MLCQTCVGLGCQATAGETGPCPSCYDLFDTVEELTSIDLPSFIDAKQVHISVGIPRQVRDRWQQPRLDVSTIQQPKSWTPRIDFMSLLRGKVRTRCLSGNQNKVEKRFGCDTYPANGTLSDSQDLVSINPETSQMKVLISFVPSSQSTEQLPRKRRRVDAPLSDSVWHELFKSESFVWRRVVSVQIASFLLSGKYCKYCRTLSQSRWRSGKEDLNDKLSAMPLSSIEEILGECLESRFRARQIKLIGSGREDWDVRMLGDGRDFLLEIESPTLCNTEGVQEALQTFCRMHKIKLRHLQFSRGTFQDIAEIKRKFGTESEMRVKYYGIVAKCDTECPMDTGERLQTFVRGRSWLLEQKTPIRVMHRRAWKCRMRSIQDINVAQLDGSLFVLRLSAQGGTYVKEFVHGDRGRTKPCLGDIFREACSNDFQRQFDILQLDVLGVAGKISQEDSAPE